MIFAINVNLATTIIERLKQEFINQLITVLNQEVNCHINFYIDIVAIIVFTFFLDLRDFFS